MKITHFEIRNFRNIESVKIAPSSGLTAFWGSNGQGKTNLIEALHACLRGKSFRNYATREDWIPEAAPGGPTAVQIFLEDSKSYPQDCELRRNPVDKKWTFLLNGKKTRARSIAEKVPVVVFSPDDHAMIRSGPEVRRHYVDNLWTDICPGYVEALDRYEKSLKSRNELLKNPEIHRIREELHVWTELVAASAVDVAQLRRDLWPRFQERFLRISRELFADAEKPQSLTLEENVPAQGELTKELYLAAHREGFDRDLATGWTHRGPHRDDFSILMERGGESRTRASQGQARLYALALRWTHAEWVKDERGEPPLFFIDDFSSELDSQRRETLLTLIHRQSGQLIMTGTERSLVDSGTFSDYTHYHVKTGHFDPLP